MFAPLSSERNKGATPLERDKPSTNATSYIAGLQKKIKPRNLLRGAYRKHPFYIISIKAFHDTWVMSIIHRSPVAPVYRPDTECHQSMPL